MQKQDKKNAKKGVIAEAVNFAFSVVFFRKDCKKSKELKEEAIMIILAELYFYPCSLLYRWASVKPIKIARLTPILIAKVARNFIASPVIIPRPRVDTWLITCRCAPT